MIDRLIELARKWSAWSDEAEWHSWVIHGVLAVPIFVVALILSLILLFFRVPPALASGLVAVVSTFLYREGEQVLHRKMGEVALSPRDHIMDVVVPAAVAVGIVGIGQWVLSLFR